MNEPENTADKASIRRFYEETTIMLSSTQSQVQFLREEVQNLSTDLENAQKKHKKWIEHLEKVFSETLLAVYMKELDKQCRVREDMENLVKQLNAKFEMVQKPRRRWFGR